MGETSKRIKVPEFSDVLYINYELVTTLGGFYQPPFNLSNPGSLEWALERICVPLIFGVDLYPTLAHKAALLSWTIINDHVFNDGCKRTGLVTALVFLSLNGKRIDITDEEIYKIAKRIAVYYKEPFFTFDELVAWFQKFIK